MTAINAELALEYVKLLAAMHVKYPESVDYRRGAIDLADSFAIYLESLIADPAGDAFLDWQDREHERGKEAA